MTTTDTPATTSGLPTAKGFLPQGTPAHVCIGYNRTCKTIRLIVGARAAGLDDTLTDDQMDAIATDVNVRATGGDETRQAVRAGLLAPFSEGVDDRPEQIAEAVTQAAYRGLPFQYRTANGQTVLLVPIPIGE